MKPTNNNMDNPDKLTLNPKDWPQGSRAIIVLSDTVDTIEVQVLEWSPSEVYVRVKLFDSINEPREWRKPETDWQLIERLPGTFGR